jgi:tetratricopeptide (TPR) repeat protein
MRVSAAFSAGAFVALLGYAAPAAAWGLPDDLDGKALRAENPDAAALVDKGMALASAGAFEDARALFQLAEATCGENSVPWQRDCEASTALGDRVAAIHACSNALERRHSAHTVRAMVSALVDSGSAPTTTELYQALAITEREQRLTPWLPTGAAATCDIAMSIGDGIMLQRCTEELERTAPDDAVTKRALNTLSSRCPPLRFWGGWLAIALAILGTIVDALRRRLAPRLHGRAAVTAAVAVGWLAASVSALADDTPSQGHDLQSQDPLQHADPAAVAKGLKEHHLSKWGIDDDNPEQHIPSEKERNADPMEFGYWLQDVAAKAGVESRLGKHGAAAKLYATLAMAVPDRAVSFTLMCSEYEAMGDLHKAIDACADALVRDGALVKDYIHFVGLVLSEPVDLSVKEKAALDQVLKHMREDPAGHDVVDELECEVGSRTANIAQLEECTAGLAQRSPDDAKTLSYEWALAVEKGDFAGASALLDRAKAAGVPQEMLARMQKRTDDRRMHRMTRLLFGALAAALLVVGIFLAAKLVKRRRQPSTMASAPAAA